MTLAEMVTQIRTTLPRYGIDSNISLSEILHHINLAKNEICAKLSVYVKQSTVSPDTSGGNEYTLPSDLVKVMRVTDADTSEILRRLNKYAGSENSELGTGSYVVAVYETVGTTKLYTWEFSLDTGYKKAADYGDLVIRYQAVYPDATEDSLDSSITGHVLLDDLVFFSAMAKIMLAFGNPVGASNYQYEYARREMSLPTDISVGG